MSLDKNAGGSLDKVADSFEAKELKGEDLVLVENL